MDQYRTTGVMDKAALQEVQKYLFRTRLEWVRWIAVAIIAGCALLALIARDWFDGGLYLFLAAFVFLLPRLIQRRYIKNQLARMRENSPEGVTRYESFLPFLKERCPKLKIMR